MCAIPLAEWGLRSFLGDEIQVTYSLRNYTIESVKMPFTFFILHSPCQVSNLST